MPKVQKLQRRPLRIIGDTTDDRYLKTSASNKIVVEITKQAAFADLCVGPHTASLSLVFASSSHRYLSISNSGGLAGLSVENDILCGSLETFAGSIKSGTTLRVLGVSTLEGDVTLKETAGVSKRLILGDSQVSLNKSAANELTIVASAIKATSTLTITGRLDVDDVRIDGKIVETPAAADDLTVRGGVSAQLLLGRDGDFDVFGTVKRRFGPTQALKGTLGSASLPWAEAFIHGLLDASVVGVRGKYVADTFSFPPTAAQLDAAFGTPAALGQGFIGTIESTVGGSEYVRAVVSDGASWWYGGTSFTEAV